MPVLRRFAAGAVLWAVCFFGGIALFLWKQGLEIARLCRPSFDENERAWDCFRPREGVVRRKRNAAVLTRFDAVFGTLDALTQLELLSREKWGFFRRFQEQGKYTI